MSGDDERFDGMFLAAAQQSRGVEPLLNALFGFLRRKTDFFTGASPQQVEDLVLKVVRNQAATVARDVEVARKKKEAEEKKKAALLAEKMAREMERLEKEAAEKEAAEKAAAEAPAAVSEAVDDDVLEPDADGNFDATKKPNHGPTPAEAHAMEEYNEDENSHPPLGNGGSTDRYVWTQTLAEVTVNIPVPPGTKSKMMDITIAASKVKVALKGGETIIDAPLHKRIIVDDSFWTVEDNEVVLNLQKENRMEWWKCVCVGDPEIDTTKVQPENSKLDDLDSETRKTVEKMMFDQRQKALGLPSSDELQKQSMLEKFMKAHPEMDFSQAKFT